MWPGSRHPQDGIADATPAATFGPPLPGVPGRTATDVPLPPVAPEVDADRVRREARSVREHLDVLDTAAHSGRRPSVHDIDNASDRLTSLQHALNDAHRSPRLPAGDVAALRTARTDLNNALLLAVSLLDQLEGT